MKKFTLSLILLSLLLVVALPEKKIEAKPLQPLIFIPVVQTSQPHCLNLNNQPNYAYELESLNAIVSEFLNYDNVIVSDDGKVTYTLNGQTAYETWLSCSTVIWEYLDCVEFIQLGIVEACNDWETHENTTFQDWLEFRVYVMAYYDMGLNYSICYLHEDLSYSCQGQDENILISGELYNH